KYVLLILLQAPFLGWSQSNVSLDSCIDWAYRHYEYEKQVQAYQESAALADENIGKSWYPQLMLDGNATYQNENLSIPVGIPGFEGPKVPLNFNRLLVQFNQTIYDGSVTANKRKLEQSKYSMLEKKIETEKIAVKSKVTGIYMSILLTSDNMSILRSKRTVVVERLKVIQSAKEYGTVSPVTFKSLKAEILKIDQQIIEIEHTKKSLYLSLGEITGKEISDSSELVKPSPIIIFDNNVDSRPEIQLLDMQIENYEFQKDMIGTSRNLRVNAFGNLGAGYPGYDIFKDEVAFMAMIGLGIKWNILDYGKAKNEKQMLSLNQDIASSEQNRARSRFVTELKSQKQELEKMQELLAKDEEMISLRAEITIIKASELENGTITSTDYITELNLEEEARLNQAIHELKLVLA
ncbi:MAG: TolC family protein, partial [Cyclobacteriaceae bacterium]|nr:TolC family protein [Cyclobacteriaceae bacterium]